MLDEQGLATRDVIAVLIGYGRYRMLETNLIMQLCPLGREILEKLILHDSGILDNDI
jgi:hypothetical protein